MHELLQLIVTTIDLDQPIDGQTPLISSGMIDSFDVVNLVSAMEEHYGVELAVEELSVESFDTPEQMHRWLEAQR
jgi:acyl carrier protein